MRVTILIITFIMFFSCEKEKKYYNVELLKNLNSIELFSNKNILFEVLDGNKNKKIIVNIKIREPFVYSNKTLQDLMCLYVIKNVEILNEYEGIVDFNFFIETEENKYTKSFTLEDRKSIVKKISKNESLIKMIEYSLSKMKEVDPYLINILQEVVYKKYPTETLNNHFVELLISFSNKTGNKKLDTSEDKVILGKSSFTFYNLIDLCKTVEKEEYQSLLSVLNDLWEINYGKSVKESIIVNESKGTIYYNEN